METTCCNPAHLFAGTKKDNGEDAKRKGRTAVGIRNGMHTCPEARRLGEKNPMAKLRWRQVRRIRRLVARGYRQNYIANKFGVDPMTVSLIVRNKIWKEAETALGSEVQRAC
jgi:DNA invertase Pin-like site-specific DNA recombinase